MQDQKTCKVVLITEHWKTAEQLNVLALKQFKLAASFCRNDGEHGGVAVYLHNSVKYKNRKDISNMSQKGEMECAGAECSINGRKLVVISIYRPCNGSKDLFLNLFENLLEKSSKENLEVIIGGDFNIEMREENKYKLEVEYLLNSFAFHIHINDHTRVSNNINSCIDNIFSNLNCEVKGSVIENHISDHRAQKISFQAAKVEKRQSSYKRVFSDVKKQAFLTNLGSQNWESVYSIDRSRVDYQWKLFINTYINIFNEHFPKKLFKNVELVKNIVYDDARLKNCKERLDLLLVLSKSSENYREMYKATKIEYDNVLIEAKKNHYKNRLVSSDNKTKSMWAICNEIKGKELEKCDCRIAGTPSEVAENYNKFLLDIIPNLVKNINNQTNSHNESKNDRSMFLKPFTPQELCELAHKLKNKFSSGIDEIPINIVKISLEKVKHVLCYILNNSFRYGIFPNHLKVSVIKPLYKSGDPERFENYRPISLPNSFSKVFELAMCKRLLQFFKECNLFSDSQHGYLVGRSTHTAIFQFTKNILDFLENHLLVAGLFIDLSKAFDCLDRTYIIHKLNQYGVSGNAVNWFRSYLSDRKQCVSITKNRKTEISSLVENYVGVPQGSVLGPYLFLIFINDLDSIITDNCSAITNFADDTNLLVSGSNKTLLQENCSNLFQKAKIWFNKNKLVLNEKKTSVVIFSTNTKDKISHLTINNEQTATVESVKFLGVEIDKLLKWSSHIETLTKKLSQVCYAIRIINKYIDYSVTKILYYANFESRMRYGIIFWGINLNTNSVFKVQKRILRIMLKMQYRESCRGKFRQEGLLTVYGMYLHECLLYFFKNKEWFLQNNINHNYNTRTLNINFPTHRLTMTERSPSYMCIKIYNHLKTEIKSIINLREFNKKTKKFLVDLEPYSLNEYFDIQ